MDDQTGQNPSVHGQSGKERSDQAGYRVLARKYRPRDFTDLIGQAPMVRTLTNAFETGRIAQAWMLTGVRGVGKTTTARILARGLNYKTDTIDRPTIDLTEIGEHCQAIMDAGHIIHRPPRDGHMAFIKTPDGISIELLQDGYLEPQEPWASMENSGSW